MTLPFRGELVRVRRNRLLPGIFAVPLALSLYAWHLGNGPVALVGLGQLTLVAVLLFTLLWRRNPWPRRELVDVQAGALGLRVGHRVLPRETLRDGFVVPVAGETKVVFNRRGLRLPVEFVTQGIAEARRVLLGLGFDASQTVARFRTLSRVLADLRSLWLGLLFVPMIIVMTQLTPHSREPFLLAALGVPLFMAILVTAWPTRLTVGADGIELRWLGWRRFVRHSDIVSASRYEAGMGNSRYAGVALLLQDGKELRIPITQRRTGNEERIHVVLERIREAGEEASRGHGELDPALLARGDRDVAGWLSALRGLGAGGNVTWRTAPIDPDRLWRVVEDHAAEPVARAAAAVALTAEPSPDVRRRLRVAAAATALPKLRIAIEAAATSDDAALSEALGEMDEESKPPRARQASAGRE